MMSKSWRNPIIFYYISNWLYRHHVPVLPKLFQTILYLLCNAVVPYRTEIGPNCLLGHGGSGVVIHPLARIGQNVMICQQVTVGGTGHNKSLPVIGNDVFLGAGAKILGQVEIGNSCVIGANAVVLKSVPSNSIAAGVPARLIRTDIDAHSIEEW